MKSVALALLVLLLSLQFGSPVQAADFTPVADADVLVQLAIYGGDDPVAAADAGATLADFGADRVAPALAAALTHEDTRDAALRYVRLALPDPRLAPYIRPLLATTRDRTLYAALLAARVVPDRIYIPALLDHALNSDYLVISCELDSDLGEVRYASTFAEAAELLYTLTNGGAGISAVTRDTHPPASADRAPLLATWRAWWATQPQN